MQARRRWMQVLRRAHRGAWQALEERCCWHVKSLASHRKHLAANTTCRMSSGRRPAQHTPCSPAFCSIPAIRPAGIIPALSSAAGLIRVAPPGMAIPIALPAALPPAPPAAGLPLPPPPPGALARLVLHLPGVRTSRRVIKQNARSIERQSTSCKPHTRRRKVCCTSSPMGAACHSAPVAGVTPAIVGVAAFGARPVLRLVGAGSIPPAAAAPHALHAHLLHAATHAATLHACSRPTAALSAQTLQMLPHVGGGMQCIHLTSCHPTTLSSSSDTWTQVPRPI